MVNPRKTSSESSRSRAGGRGATVLLKAGAASETTTDPCSGAGSRVLLRENVPFGVAATELHAGAWRRPAIVRARDVGRGECRLGPALVLGILPHSVEVHERRRVAAGRRELRPHPCLLRRVCRPHQHAAFLLQSGLCGSWKRRVGPDPRKVLVRHGVEILHVRARGAAECLVARRLARAADVLFSSRARRRGEQKTAEELEMSWHVLKIVRTDGFVEMGRAR